MIDREDFMAWVASAIEAYPEMGGDPRYCVNVEIEGDVVECVVEYFSEDNLSDAPNETDTLQLTIK